MVSTTFGEKDWEEEGAKAAGSGDFFPLKDDGQYAIRILGKPHEYASHWVEGPTKKTRANCAGRDCVLCKAGHKASVRYLLPIILRKGPGVSQPKMAATEVGPQVYNGIRTLYKTAEWGNPTTFDLMVDKNKRRGPSGTYFVTPLVKKPLTDQEKVDAKEFLEKLNLGKYSAALSNREIIEKLGPELCQMLGIQAGGGQAAAAQSQSSDLDFGGSEDEYSFNK